MKAMAHFRSLLRWPLVLAFAALVTSCGSAGNNGKPQRDEPSPFAPQWRPFHHRH
jgi:hypothetical protein